MPADNATTIIYCDLKNFNQAFRVYHSYLGLFVCIFGSITNVLNIVVLTRKEMKCPTNFVLTGLAIADLLVMLGYIPFVIISSDNRKYAYHFTYAVSIFIIFHALYTQAFHFISCCLTVILAIWRYVFIKFPRDSKRWCGDRATKLTIFLTYLLCPIICTPLFLSLEIRNEIVKVDTAEKILPNNSTDYYTNATIYHTDYKNDIFKNISFYVYGVVIKLIPCILLTILSSLIILELLEGKKRRRRLLGSRNKGEDCKRKCSQRHVEKERQSDRTTRMLLAVLLLFVMVEFPQAIFGVLNQIVGEKFEKQCYQPLGDLIDIFALTNSAINFVLYCTMSVKFRVAFKKVFFPYLMPCSQSIKENWTSMVTLKANV